VSFLCVIRRHSFINEVKTERKWPARLMMTTEISKIQNRPTTNLNTLQKIIDVRDLTLSLTHFNNYYVNITHQMMTM
jgi:hypothetical protein